MAPQSPARAAAPPPYAPHAPYHHHQWPPAPPNVYVSQVTANVNVHGYMGQYYQPPQPQYGPPPAERPQRNARHRRPKRAPSPPPPQPPPYYVQYPQYYPAAAQAQGAPLYHLPMYQPLVYGPYAYPSYAYPEYPMPVEGDPNEKPPEEYQPEVVMEQEAVEAYYGGAQYAGAAYGGAEPMEYMPPMYLPPPHAALPPPAHHAHHAHHAPPPPAPPAHLPAPHTFNVHAKNFVQGQPHKNYAPPDKLHEPKPSTPTAVAAAVDALPVKDLKINKDLASPKPQQTAEPVKTLPPAEKPPSSPKMDAVKPSWVPDKDANLQGKNFPPVVSAASPAAIAGKVPPAVNKPMKGPAAPFSGNKPAPKLPLPQTAVPVQQAVSTPKPPFGNRQKREGATNRSPTSETEAERPAAEHAKREPPLPPSKAPMPISITMGPAGPPTIVASKPPFGHSRKPAAPEPAPAPQPPPPAPTASDFPPPPTPRNRGEPAPAPVLQPQPAPAPGKSWASLFSSKSAAAAAAPAPAPPPDELPPSPTPGTAPPIAPNVQKPVAKVPPFDASPSLAAVDKTPPAPRPVAVTTATPTVSYSEKTSVNAVSNAAVPPTITKPAVTQLAPEVKEIPIQKEVTPALPVAPSPFSDDPNSYRMGEFLIKYQLDNRPVNLMPRGLTNRSNYCYVNAILQALIACPPFYNMLKALPYQTRKGKSSTPVIDSMVELCYEFSVAGAGGVGTARRRGEAAPAVGGAPPLDGAAGLRVLRALRPFVGSQDARQEDAEEFLGCLLNSLNDEMLELMKLVEPDEPKDAVPPATPNGIIAPEPVIEDEDDDDEWKVMGRRNRGSVERRWSARRTPLGDVFRGATRLRLTRASTAVTDAVQPFFSLQLDLQRANTVKDALELLAGKDTLEGVDAWQQLSIEQLPVVLLLHLKCFQLDADGHTAKIVKSIDFPVDLKIDPKIMSSKQKYTTKQRMYKLFAVVYHEGVEAVKGHYLTDTFHGQAGWIRYDDSTVTQVTEAAVLKPKPPRMPYLLMYRRHDTLPVHRVNPKE